MKRRNVRIYMKWVLPLNCIVLWVVLLLTFFFPGYDFGLVKNGFVILDALLTICCMVGVVLLSKYDYQYADSGKIQLDCFPIQGKQHDYLAVKMQNEIEQCLSLNE